jgi:O-antigen/teichoic acid export membrane protein
MGVMNVATYGFAMLAARVLGPRAYGALASLMATLLVISVLQLGLQATAARRIATEPEHVEQIERVLLGVTYRAALGLGLLLLLLSPVLSSVLRLDDVTLTVLVAVSAVPLTVMGGQAGILQGERRWRSLGLVYVFAGVPRLVVGTLLVLVSPTATAAMLGVTLATFPSVVIGWWALRRRDRGTAVEDARHAAGAVVREAAHNSQALLGFFALSNADVIVARNVLPAHDAGLYAGGLILTKAVLFLPQFVVILAFPEMSTTGQRRYAVTRSLLVVALLGVTATLGALLLPRLALVFVGGTAYQEISDRLWLFALLGTLLAMIQLLVYAVVAGQGRRATLLVWAGWVALVAWGSTSGSLHALLTVVLLVDAALLVVLTAISLRGAGHRAPATGA